MREIIRPLRLDDVADVAARCFPELPFEEVEERVREDVAAQEQGEGVTLVVEEGGRVGLFVKMTVSGESGWIFNVIAHPDLRGRGVFQRTMAILVERARAMGLTRLVLHVRADNPAARRAYEKAGFHYAGHAGMQGAQLRYERMLNAE